jgi:hypothetical protein
LIEVPGVINGDFSLFSWPDACNDEENPFMAIATRALFVSTIVLFLGAAAAVAQWSNPIAVTSGPYNDTHPAFVECTLWDRGTFEWMAFVRSGTSGSSICLKKTSPGGLTWIDSVYAVTDDSSYNDFPSLAKSGATTMLLWQRGEPVSSILFSRNPGEGWSAPQVLMADALPSRSPHVAPYASSDSSFAAVWESGGRIMYSRYAAGSWGAPERVSVAGDTLNFRPKVICSDQPLVLWEAMKPGDGMHAVVYSLRTNSGWSVPDSLSWSGDNRQVANVKASFGEHVLIAYSSNRSGNREMRGAEGWFSSGNFAWHARNDSIVALPGTDDLDPSFTFIPYTTRQSDGAPGSFGAVLGVWRSVSGTSDSICTWQGTTHFLTAAPGVIDRSPALATGVFLGALHLWVVWEGNLAGQSHLYGSRIDIVTGVDEPPGLPSGIRLHQNYPNPFNPSTTIRYSLSHSSSVTLTVHNTLGQQVVQLVNEHQQAGYHDAVFRGDGLASGVYFYKLEAEDFVQTKKLLLLK